MMTYVNPGFDKIIFENSDENFGSLYTFQIFKNGCEDEKFVSFKILFNPFFSLFCYNLS